MWINLNVNFYVNAEVKQRFLHPKRAFVTLSFYLDYREVWPAYVR